MINKNKIINIYMKNISDKCIAKIMLGDKINNYIEGLWNQAPEMLIDEYNWNKFINLLNSVIKSEPTGWKNQIRIMVIQYLANVLL